MKYRLDHNTFLRTFENVTVLDNQVNHVRKTVSGHDKAFVDRLTYNGFTEATAEEATLAERLHSLWMIVAEGEKDHDFTYTDKRKTEEWFAQYDTEDADIVPQPWLNSLEIIITSKCNERCSHCYIPNAEKDSATTLDKETVKDAIRQFRDMNGLKLNLSGGEPLLHPDIWELLEYGRERNLMLSINSNMLLLTDEMVKRLKDLRPYNIQVSLYSTQPDIHDSITNRKGSFERTVKSIGMLVSHDIPVMISCPVMHENHNSIAGIRDYASSLGIDCYFDYIMMAQNNGSSDNLANCLTPEETKTAIRQIVETDPVYMDAIKGAPSYEALMKMQFARRWSSCRIMANRICLDADGTLFPCPGWNGMKLDDIRECRLQDVWTSSQQAAALRAVNQHEFNKCRNCNLHNFCDMCPVYNANENGSLDKVSTRFCTAAATLREVVTEIYRT